MERLLIEGGRRINGELGIHGAKNAVLPILAGTLLCKETVLHNCPCLSDVEAAEAILETLGCTVSREGETLVINAINVTYCDPPEYLMREMRSSILFLGAILARCGCARVSFPGGCELGARPVDMHIEGLKKLGAIIEEDHGFFDCRVISRLKGAKITLPFPSVGATENIILAATTAEGTTVIQNAAREPEIQDLADFLNVCGAKILVMGDYITIDGVSSLGGGEHNVIPDRIEAATYLCAAAITGGSVDLKRCRPQQLTAVLPVMEEMGCRLKLFEDAITLAAPERLLAVRPIKTMPFPGFPTDAQAPIMAALCVSKGTSMIVENIFEARYKHAGELLRMGARIETEGRVAVVEGVPALHSAAVKCTDLRGGAALVIAALAANGVSALTELRHLDRGYADLEAGLRTLGAKITRERN
ncbi:MAG TPA: UDP-N-acetylglucosamine 1-carboxyvinyltransferase [Clostridia bacterium]|nr:UDP-N-acetylglucosamine 1-carboxyvinyltransferase [Clostridia bacterium]